MPTYEYECPGCGRRFEKFEGINAQPSGTCPKCGTAGRRLISAGGGILLKGRAGSPAARMQERCGHDGPCCGAESVCGTPHCISE
jgi:putative FmdB family regulatory protein